jgi:hypothetical protein
MVSSKRLSSGMKSSTELWSLLALLWTADKCVYYRYGGAEGVILCLYMDDILIFGTSLNVIKEVKEFLSQSFEMKDLGETDVILNIKLVKESNGEVILT